MKRGEGYEVDITTSQRRVIIRAVVGIYVHTVYVQYIWDYVKLF